MRTREADHLVGQRPAVVAPTARDAGRAVTHVTTGDWRDAAPRMLSRLGRSLGADRAAVLRNTEDGRAAVCISWRRSRDVTAWPRMMGYADEVRVALDEGRHVRLVRRDSRDQRESVLLVPVAAAGMWWGSLAFASSGKRVWDAGHAAAAHAVATVLGSAIHGARRESEWRAATRRLLRAHETDLRRISDGLQDDVLQLLSATHAQLEVVRGRASGDPALLEVVQQSGNSLRLGLSRIRELALGGAAVGRG